MGSEQYNMDEISDLPRENIPAEWAHRGNCPICNGVNSLGVQHFPEAPDQFVCQDCETAFELHSNSSKIRVMALPEVLKPAWMEVINRWMSPEEIRRLYQRYSAVSQPPTEDPEEQVPELKLTNREVMFQALELQRLGNSFEKIEMLLFQAGATPQQVAGALQRLKQSKAKTSRRRGCMFWGMGIVAVSILLLIAGVLWLTSRPVTPDIEGQPTTIVDSLLPAFDPGEIVSEFVNIPTPHVVKSGPGVSRCPANAQQAAELFGGEEEYWTKESGFNAWAMVSTSAPITVRVPENMYAGYMKLDSMGMISVQGPATIQNLNFVIITCN